MHRTKPTAKLINYHDWGFLGYAFVMHMDRGPNWPPIYTVMYKMWNRPIAEFCTQYDYVYRKTLALEIKMARAAAKCI